MWNRNLKDTIVFVTCAPTFEKKQLAHNALPPTHHQSQKQSESARGSILQYRQSTRFRRMRVRQKLSSLSSLLFLPAASSSRLMPLLPIDCFPHRFASTHFRHPHLKCARQLIPLLSDASPSNSTHMLLLSMQSHTQVI